MPWKTWKSLWTKGWPKINFRTWKIGRVILKYW